MNKKHGFAKTTSAKLSSVSKETPMVGHFFNVRTWNKKSYNKDDMMIFINKQRIPVSNKI